MYKTVSEVTPVLARRYDGPIAQREGAGGRSFSYVPWTVTKRLLDEVFGVFGWSTSEPRSYFANGAYNVEFGLTVSVADDETGATIAKTVPAQGQAIARGENDDNALKSAQSDALSRGAKMLGDAFGFFLYEEKGGASSQGYARSGGAPTQTSQTRPISNSGGAGATKYPATEKQIALLRKKGVGEDVLATISKKEASERIDALMNGGGNAQEQRQPVGAGASASARPTYDADDDLPF